MQEGHPYPSNYAFHYCSQPPPLHVIFAKNSNLLGRAGIQHVSYAKCPPRCTEWFHMQCLVH